jgi:hypothetical protein
MDKEVKKEGAFMVYKKKDLVAIIKRDEISGKHLVYVAREATSDDIAELIGEVYPLGK